ncbi:hypothetical protein NC652_039203 [Populus alba x Populus x berolinensis]|uniref:Transcription factor HY5 n=1 Tax=Populus alba x Populus x berolinensis TaxID=444605 RepID=A0AAD6PRU7_9ROSI|nr:hypothetical protein NC652_039203 [Populus alba x Populus x berolinensis]KAJ6957192.1 hypothetical protein NC653_039199 [Populus alba x Populus x berolinensis]
MQEQTTSSIPANSLPSSSERSSSSAPQLEVKEGSSSISKVANLGSVESLIFSTGFLNLLCFSLLILGMESDEEIRRVPEMSGDPAGTSASGRETGSNAGPDRVQPVGEGQSQRKRGRSPADKENKRLKRLLRNRVSAQQARERKKAYLTELETRVKDLEKKNSELEERLSTLQNENQMLRHILKNTTASRRGGSSGTNAEGS